MYSGPLHVLHHLQFRIIRCLFYFVATIANAIFFQEAERIYIELEEREHSATVIQSNIRQKQAQARVQSLREEVECSSFYLFFFFLKK